MTSARPHTWTRHPETISSAPFSFVHSTARRYPITTTSALPSSADIQYGDYKAAQKSSVAAPFEHHWRSRDNRKGRHAIRVTADGDKDSSVETPKSTSTFREAIKGIHRMISRSPYWDVSYLVAVIFTLGSVIWCINGFFAWLPLQDPSTSFPNESLYAGGITAFIGATIFEVGSILLMIEAVNENQSECFGWALEEALEANRLSLHPDPAGCKHHHCDKHGLVNKRSATQGQTTSDDEIEDKPRAASVSARKWTWMPTWHELTTHYFREIGFQACLSQMIGASIFWISGFTALPGINNVLSGPALDAIFWAPQVVGGCGFIISGTLFMLETQKKWWLPAPHVLGWHIGAWNLIGAIGFTLCGALGYSSSDAVVYESSLATFWGSWAFLIGSVIQWYESLDKYPVEVERGGGRVAGPTPVRHDTPA